MHKYVTKEKQNKPKPGEGKISPRGDRQVWAQMRGRGSQIKRLRMKYKDVIAISPSTSLHHMLTFTIRSLPYSVLSLSFFPPCHKVRHEYINAHHSLFLDLE